MRSFYGRRLNRILPTFLLIGWPLYLIRGVIGGDTVTELFLHLSTLDFWVLGRNGTATWYVSFILLLYLAYPFLHRPLSGSRWVMGFLLVNAIVFAVNGLMAVFCEDFFLNYWEMGQTRIPVFLVGMIMGRREMAGKANRTWMAAASLLAFLVVYRIYDMATGGYGTGTGRLLYRFSMIFLALFISFFVCICNDWIPDNILRRAFLAIGSVSLELYLSHALLKGVFSRSGLQQSHNTPLYYLLYVVLPAMVISFAAKRKISIYDKKKICYNRKRNI